MGPIILLPGQSYTVDQTPGTPRPTRTPTTRTYKCVNLVDGSVVAQGTGTSAPFHRPRRRRRRAVRLLEPAQADRDEHLVDGQRPGQPVTVDRSWDRRAPSTDHRHLTPNTPDSTVSNGGKQLTVPGEGTWTVDPQSGKVTFTPESGSTKKPTPVTYTVDDTRGNQTRPDRRDVQGERAARHREDHQGTAVTVDVLANDQGGTVASSVVLPTSGQPTGAQVSTDGKQLTVPARARTRFDRATGKVTFTPDPRSAVPLARVVPGRRRRRRDVHGDDHGAGRRGRPDGEERDRHDAAEHPDHGRRRPRRRPGVQGGTPSTRRRSPSRPRPAGRCHHEHRRPQLTVPGQGTYTADPTTGRSRSPRRQGFTGTTTPVTYQVGDTGGATGTGTLTVTVTAVTPTAKDDTVTLAQGDTATVDVLGNDTPGNAATPLDPTSVTFPGNGTKQLTVPGEGSYAIDPKSGKVTFTPERPSAAPRRP